MFKILLSIIFMICSLCISYAEGEKDLTSPNFTLDIHAMDPVTHDLPYDSNLQGTKAFLFILGKIADMLLFIVPIIAGISLVVAGYYYIFSSGDTEKASQAKTIIKWNIVALLIAFLSYTLVQMVLYIMNLL